MTKPYAVYHSSHSLLIFLKRTHVSSKGEIKEDYVMGTTFSSISEKEMEVLLNDSYFIEYNPSKRDCK